MPPVTAILHAENWPSPAAVEALKQRLREALADVELEVIEAPDPQESPRGAAAALNNAATNAHGQVLLVVPATSFPESEDLRALVAAAQEALAVAQLPRGGSRDRGDVEHESAAGRAVGVGHGEGSFLAQVYATLQEETAAVSDLVWAIDRAHFEALGGLDEGLWSIGYVEDLVARGRFAGIAVREIPVRSESRGGPAYRVTASLARFLSIRNPLLTAYKTLPAAELGQTLAIAAARAIISAWGATGLEDGAFRFGGSWGRRGLFARLTGGGARLPVQLQDADGCLLPLLAIDAAIEEFEHMPRPRWAAVAPALGMEPPPTPSAPMAGLPTLSVLVVNWNGREHLRDCFSSLLRSDYPADKVELICVDNGSTDGSRELLQAEFPQVRIVALDRNQGFTGGNEAGVAAARGEVFVFLNNDMRVEPDFLRELVRGLESGSACAGARVLSWDGRAIDFIRGSLNFEARGFQDSYGVRNSPELATPTETFFPNGGAFAVTREAYTRAGGFDPAFFAYYDDVDLGWRLRLTGAGIRVAGRAVVYHRHGATSRTQPKGQKRFLMERNALWTLMKNYGEPALRRTFGVALALAIRRLLDETNIDRHAPLARTLAPFSRRCRRSGEMAVSAVAAVLYARDRRGDGEGAHRPSPALRWMPLESLGATAAALKALPRIIADRARIQAQRTVADADILPRFGRNLEAVSSVSSYKHLQHVLAEAHDLSELFRTRTRLLIIGHEAIAKNMSGPAVRVLEMGRALSSVARVTIATPTAADVEDTRVTFATFTAGDHASLRRIAEDADVLLVQGFTLSQYPFLKSLHVPVIVDLYCPFTLEHLEQLRARGGAPEALRDAAGVLGVQNDQLRDGDFFLCASEAQRDFWIGALHSHGRINPLTYAEDPTLRRLIDVVPFGLPEESATAAATHAQAAANEPNKPVMKGVRPGIAATDRVLLWAGSMLDWQDPLTLIRAVADLVQRGRRDIKLLFMGTRHPNPLVSPMKVVEDSRVLAQQLGVLDTHVFLNDWVPYDQRARYLVEADLGVSTHRDHLETHFSFRTRMLDYIWAGLPIVCTSGDFFAGVVAGRGAGIIVPPGDVTALSQAIADVLDDPAKTSSARAALQALREELRWSTVVAPLARYCAQPAFAADRAPEMQAFRSRLEQQYRGSKWLKRTALRLGLSEYRIERLKASNVGRAAMTAQGRLALYRARRAK